jgi:hypothetical protein
MAPTVPQGLTTITTQEVMMATRKSTTKALKAKVTQRTAAKRKAKEKSKPTCQVVAASAGQAKDIDRYNVPCRE